MKAFHLIILVACVSLRLLGCGLAGSAGEPLRELHAGDEPRFEAAPEARIALVLSSGGLRGFVHLGVLKALEAQGVKPDLIVGVSAGAVTGALYASGLNAAELVATSLEAKLESWTDPLMARSTRSAQLERFVALRLRSLRIEQFPIRFAAVATDLRRGCLAVFNAGDAARAVHASSSLPGVFFPVRIGGQDYVDGGLVSPLPARLARALGAERVIAVDVTFHPHNPPPEALLDSMFHAGMLMVRNLADPDFAEADLVIEPKLPGASKVTLANRAALITAGERAALASMPQIHALVARTGRVSPTLQRGAEPRWCTSPAMLQIAWHPRAVNGKPRGH